MKDILERLRNSSPDEGSHELFCRCLDAATEIEDLRNAHAAAIRRAVMRRQALVSIRDQLQQVVQDANEAVYGAD